ncbi:DMT family transporter [Brevibacillus sp. TJ4]|uniref:DMT family transporter n=1 Tax=Brevibacillus sp. TJ4 TaxID=3234853 RepID=UPI003BA08B81
MQRPLFLALLLLSLMWGGSFFFIKILLPDFEPLPISFLRSGFGLATIVLIMLVTRQKFGWKSIPWPLMIVVGLVNTAVPWTLIGLSETKLTSSMASVLNATTPLWTMVVGILFFKAASNFVQWLGIAIAFVGILVLVDVNPESFVSVDLVGLFCMLTATLCYGIGTQLSRRLSGLTLYQTTFGTLLTTTLATGIASLLWADADWAQVAAWHNLGALVGLGVFGSGVAYILFYYLVQKGSPEFATLVTYLLPVTAIIWGYTLLDEAITWNLLAGMMLVLCGVFVAGRKANKAAVVDK